MWRRRGAGMKNGRPGTFAKHATCHAMRSYSFDGLKRRENSRGTSENRFNGDRLFLTDEYRTIASFLDPLRRVFAASKGEF